MNILTPQVRSQSISDTEKELQYYDLLHSQKCRDKGQNFQEHSWNIASRLGSTELHQYEIYTSLINKRFLPAGRIQAALGAKEREVSPFNCSVSQKIEDDMDSIMGSLYKAAKILRLGTGIGYNFSHLRPKGDLIKKLDTDASGPLSFMRLFDVMASTIASSGHRRGAQMGIMNVNHPDIEDFIDAKMQKDTFRYFNLSVGVSDLFMHSVANDTLFALTFNGKVYKEISARYLWNKILTNAYNSAEPGVIFIDRLNQNNNLYYCEDIEATNPCAEQPLPPNGLCCLGSFNLPAYLRHTSDGFVFDVELFKQDIWTFVEAYDNIFDNAVYAVPEHKIEALNKRRIGLGFTGIATCFELLENRACYGEYEFCERLDALCEAFRNEAYSASAYLAKTRGAFPLYNKQYLDAPFINTLPDRVRNEIAQHGIRNSHIISFAPCGTISQYAGNVSSGVEPIFYHSVSRSVHMREGQEQVTLTDYAYRNFGFKGKTLEECSVKDHLNVAEIIQKYTDSAVSKTVNVAATCKYEEYAEIYKNAYEMGLKGITVYRPTELRGAVITKAEEKKEEKTIEQAFTSCANGICTL